MTVYRGMGSMFSGKGINRLESWPTVSCARSGWPWILVEHF